ncbi:formate dehydrogenase subunit gamma [Qingshengfaniella alkalisoli]|uniref:Formate dehydrogenase subunit gamma n=1 Tax=Qingshengfaniella alkalisoli TaxID=2599296 RepID=A0A5B8I8X8_9RHOB|nr:formate dehydrogenase subunit gamma [Qingshengfaniella alkalisoli]
MTRMARVLLLVVLTCVAPVAFAQSPGSGPINGATPGDTNAAGSSDADLWRAVRAGDSFTSQSRVPMGNQLIQSAGHDWELTRNGPLAMYTAWIITGMLVLLSIFFALRGRIRIDAGKSGQTIKRFTLVERSAHWMIASSFVLLALTGLSLLFGRKILIPLMGHEAFSVLAYWGKHIHNYVGFAFMAGIAIIFVMWVIHNIPRPSDLVWIARGGGLFGGGHPPAHKFNAGQKGIFWAVIVCGTSLALSGWALLTPFTTTMFADTFSHVNAIFGTTLPTDLTIHQEQQFQEIWHTIMAAIMIAIIIAHIYIGTVGMEGAVDAMTHGDVDLNWAKEHHSLWVAEKLGKDTPRSSHTPAE